MRDAWLTLDMAIYAIIARARKHAYRYLCASTGPCAASRRARADGCPGLRALEAYREQRADLVAIGDAFRMVAEGGRFEVCAPWGYTRGDTRLLTA